MNATNCKLLLMSLPLAGEVEEDIYKLVSEPVHCVLIVVNR